MNFARLLPALGLAAAAAFATAPAQAAVNLNGHSIQGWMAFDADGGNWLDGQAGYAMGFGNGNANSDTVVVNAIDTEFGYFDGNLDLQVDFDGALFGVYADLPTPITPDVVITLTFTDLTDSFTGLAPTLLGGSSGGWVTSIVGNQVVMTLTVGASGTFVAGYSLAPAAAPVPEPEGLALMLAGLAAVGAASRRRATAQG